ncbi:MULTISPECIES: helix-turn-helix transcriptional regulator [Dyella]|uniref:DNA-binding protein n=2 Tax=Dyella TaxID=231454 RepID=A0A4R0YVP4_9GAMM|nr:MULTISPECIES: DNA-binding protein [Dyella]TBR38893.1 DNA-binding protein [Dyella terrae]TCI13515.1 DNA-binding protein [Dyella soli]
MNSYEFTLKFQLPHEAADPESWIEALADAGCDDALVGVGQQGRIALDFARDAESAFVAVSSAVRDVQKAIPNAHLVEASPDFVGLTDVAEMAGFSRQNMRKLMTGHVATFPVPVHEGNPSLWHLAPVLAWLAEHQQRPVDTRLLDVAQVTMALNIARDATRLPGTTLPEHLAPLFG